jgi:hypothetical protein
MKKLTLVIILLSFIATSCTREYICQCTVKYSGKVPGLPDSTMTESVIKNTLKGAISDCEKNSISTTQNGVTLTETCQLY